MKTKVAPIVIALMVFGVLISSGSKFVKGQTAPKDKRIRLSKYGVVLTTPIANNKGTRDLHHEGYAIAYRVKNPKTGKEEDRLAYAFGAHQVGNLKPVKQKVGRTIVQTQDGELEITSEVKWDHKLNELRTWRSFKVIGTTEVAVLAIESYVDNSMGQDVAQVAQIAKLMEAALGRKSVAIVPGVKCDCTPCPIRPCPGLDGYKLKSGKFRALLNTVGLGHGSALIARDAPVSEMLKSKPVSVLSWKPNINMLSEPIGPGKELSAFTSHRFE